MFYKNKMTLRNTTLNVLLSFCKLQSTIFIGMGNPTYLHNTEKSWTAHLCFQSMSEIQWSLCEHESFLSLIESLQSTEWTDDINREPIIASVFENISFHSGRSPTAISKWAPNLTSGHKCHVREFIFLLPFSTLSFSYLHSLIYWYHQSAKPNTSSLSSSTHIQSEILSARLSL